MAANDFAPGSPEEAQYILTRFSSLMVEQRLFGILWQEIADYVMPRKNSIILQRVAGSKRTQRLYDSTATNAVEMLAASIDGTLTPSGMRWFFLETDIPELNAIQSVRKYLEDFSDRMLSAFNRSNLAQEEHELYLDLGLFGTACLFMEEEADDDKGRWGGFRFKTIPTGKYVGAEGPDGRMNAVFRSFPMNAEAISLQWPNTAPDEVLEAKPDKTFEIIHGCYPDKRATINSPKYRSQYIVYVGRSILGDPSSRVNKEQSRALGAGAGRGTFQEFPFMVPRWSKNSDETYGRGPTDTAMPDIRSLNKIVQLDLRALALDVHPPLKALNGDVIGPIQMVPGGVISVRGMDNLQPLLTGRQQTSEIVSERVKRLEEKIHRIYFYDQLQLPQGPQMTAEEVITRMELMQRLMGPAVGRLETEFLHPLILRAAAIMIRRHTAAPNEGILPDQPPELQAYIQRTGGAPMRVRFEGPLARAQRSADVVAIQKLQTFVLPLVQAKPDVMDVIDWDEAIRITASRLGVPAETILDQAQVQPVRDQRQQQMQEQQQMASLQQGADAAGKIAPLLKTGQTAPEPGSIDSQFAPQQGQNGATP
jgi:hypothetical protein